MNVIGHDTPLRKAVPLGIELKQRVFYQFRNLRIPKVTRAVAGVFVAD
jgi:hypothetical protein